MNVSAPLSRRVALDLVCLVVFVAIGRSSHHHGLTLSGLLSTLWPFASGLGVGWLVLVGRHRAGRSLADAAILVIVTVAVGMTLRVVSGQGTAVAFIVVALAFLSLTMGGWRLMLQYWARRRT